MLAGKVYDPTDEELAGLRLKAHKLSQRYNNTFEDEEEKRKQILDELIPHRGRGAFLQGPVYFDYGEFTSVGENFYANFNFTVLDICPVKIGDNVFFGPNCTIATPMHPFMWQERNIKTARDGHDYDEEYGDNCWFASNVVITGGVTIGDGCVIGAGSVVTRDIPPNSLAVGNPCRVIRKITEQDSIRQRKDLWTL